MKPLPLERLVALARTLDDERLMRLLKRLPVPAVRMLLEEFALWTHRGQAVPKGGWQTWLMMAGRGFGKTRAGAEWVSALARADGSLRIALVGATMDDVRKVMVHGTSGLIAVARTGESPRWIASHDTLRFDSGAEAHAYSGEVPDKLRGPEHHFAWCDEIAKWAHADATWDMLQMGLRLGDAPRAMVTTTPRPIGLLKRLRALAGTATTRGATADNPHTPDSFRRRMAEVYGGTRLGRQELDGELIEDVEGALWPRALLEASRAPHRPLFRRVVVGVDPPAGEHGDACGIVVAALGADGVGYALEDASVAGLSPEGWARAVADAAAKWGADRVIAEANNGGAMVESVLRAADAGLPVRRVHAAVGKSARAEPVAALFERGKARLAGRFPELEDELAGLTLAGGYEGPGRSPDRADAMIWAMTELMLKPGGRVPRVMIL